MANATVSLESMEFLTYPCPDDARELPIFTTSGSKLESQFALATPRPEWVRVQGEPFWLRMLEVVTADSDIQVAVDPGEPHGIRLRRDMMLGMVGKYGKAFSGG